MKEKAIACLIAVGSLLLAGCAGSSGSNQRAAVPNTQAVTATGMERSLLAALNAERRAAGKAELTVSPVLAGLARGESAAAATASAPIQGDTTAALKSRSGFGSVGKLRGVLTDRGTATGKSFVGYWLKDSRGMMMDDWSKVGVAVSKGPDGNLYAIVVLGGAGGGGGGSSLMDPGMAPSGF